MRSEKIHAAVAQGNTRFEICLLVAKGVRLTHQHGGRLEDSINNVLGMLNPGHAREPFVATPLIAKA